MWIQSFRWTQLPKWEEPWQSQRVRSIRRGQTVAIKIHGPWWRRLNKAGQFRTGQRCLWIWCIVEWQNRKINLLSCSTTEASERTMISASSSSAKHSFIQYTSITLKIIKLSSSFRAAKQLLGSRISAISIFRFSSTPSSSNNEYSEKSIGTA